MTDSDSGYGIDLLRDGHIKPMGELIDEILLHAFDYYDGNTRMMAEHLKIHKNSINRKLKHGAQHKGWKASPIDGRTIRHVRGPYAKRNQNEDPPPSNPE